jgi:hypothetical protein
MMKARTGRRLGVIATLFASTALSGCITIGARGGNKGISNLSIVFNVPNTTISVRGRKSGGEWHGNYGGRGRFDPH